MLRAIPYITSVPLIYLVLCFCFSLNVFSGTHVRTGIGAATPYSILRVMTKTIAMTFSLKEMKLYGIKI